MTTITPEAAQPTAEQKQRACDQCGGPVGHKHGQRCASCIADEMDYDNHECGNCGGEGFTYGCGWDWQCDTYDEGEGTCLCARRCEWCNPLTAAELAERQKLQDVLASGLEVRPVGEVG